MRSFAAIALCGAALLLAGCGTMAVSPAPGVARVRPPAAAASSSQQDSAPLASEIPPDVASIPDAVPHPEPYSSSGNPDSYEVYGDRYAILKDARGYKERGYASWYGKKFHGKRTASGEPYDMFKMTAAHKTLPIPCYARVTNLDNGHSVVVRINDRGPFHEGRIIDLSYTAAVKLGSLDKGSIPVEVEAIDPSMPTPTTQYAAARPAPGPPLLPSATLSATPASAPVPVPALTPPAPPLNISTMLSTATNAPTATVAAQPALAGLHFLQAGLFYDPINAVSLREQLAGLGIANVQLKSDQRNGNSVSRVLIGPFADDGALDAVRKRLGDLQLSALPVVE
jgi:rare lipoprotein A